MAYTTEEQDGVLSVKMFCQSDSVVTVQLQFRLMSDCRNGPERSPIARLVKKCNVSGVHMDFVLPVLFFFAKKTGSFKPFFY